MGGGDVDGGGGEGGTMVDGGKIEALVMEKETTEEDGGEEESHVGGSVWRSCPWKKMMMGLLGMWSHRSMRPQRFSIKKYLPSIQHNHFSKESY